MSPEDFMKMQEEYEKSKKELDEYNKSKSEVGTLPGEKKRINAPNTVNELLSLPSYKNNNN